MSDWRSADDYAWCADLDRGEWAWQFLRRNPDYRADYAWFISTWRALEAQYGAPPGRDFFRWRQDPRAWRSEAELAGCGTEACPGVGDRVLIECWMGAKWGLRQFPVDPDRPRPGGDLAWRERPVECAEVGESDGGYLRQRDGKVALGFDLALPLAPQLAAARLKLIARRRALERAGTLPPRSVAAGRGLWTRYLRLLDGEAAGTPAMELAAALGCADPRAELAEAHRMCAAGYLRILLLEH